MTARWRGSREGWERLAAAQGGVVSRAQLLGGGWSRDDVDVARRSGRWQPIVPGVYLTHTGPPTPDALVWAHLLNLGPGAALVARTALVAAGLRRGETEGWGRAAGRTPSPPRRPSSVGGGTPVPRPLLHLGVPPQRHVLVRPEVCLHRRQELERQLEPAASPPRQRVEEALLDACDELDRPEDVVSLVLAVVSARLTTSARLRAAMQGRARLRWRQLLGELSAHAEDTASRLEWLYRRQVHLAHDLPAACFNAADRMRDGSRVYRDVVYEYGVVVELDGVRFHPLHLADHDRGRDNELALLGAVTLRFGWHEVIGDPCGVARLVVSALRGRGWSGTTRVCGPGCGLVL